MKAVHVPNADDIQQAFRFHPTIDLVDETLREGAERATIAPDFEDKYKLGCSIAKAGIRSLVVGMFPDVPHNVELLKRLIEGQERGEIPEGTRFLVISHVGRVFHQTLEVLHGLGVPLTSVWVVAIHSVSDLQIKVLFPKIASRSDPAWDGAAWAALDDASRRRLNLEWLRRFLPTLGEYRGGGVMVGLLDLMRARRDHVGDVVAALDQAGVRQVRLVDTAGTCIPQQVGSYVGDLVRAHPKIDFYCHFHNDFGAATGNALLALASGARGVDVSIGGYANRAGHPPLAEIATALRDLYGCTIPGFDYESLFRLSREAEHAYGLLEDPTQPITGVLTHSVLSGIRTELLHEARTIFDVIDPASVGSTMRMTFGVRSGKDGMARFLAASAEELKARGLTATPALAERVFEDVSRAWERRSAQILGELRTTMAKYHDLLERSNFYETEILEFLPTGDPSPAGARSEGGAK